MAVTLSKKCHGMMFEGSLKWYVILVNWKLTCCRGWAVLERD